MPLKMPWSKHRTRFQNLSRLHAQTMTDLGQVQAENRALAREHTRITAERNQMAQDLAQVRAALSEVSVYEGLLDVSPVAMMVAELARDHEELEHRIDAAMMLLSDPATEHTNEMIEIGRLLQGGKRVPDDLGG